MARPKILRPADFAVMLADGGEAIADLAVLRDQTGVFGPVASNPTAWRTLASLRSARAQAREVAWLQAAEHGEGIPAARAAGRVLPGLVLDLDATLGCGPETPVPTPRATTSRCSTRRSRRSPTPTDTAQIS